MVNIEFIEKINLKEFGVLNFRTKMLTTESVSKK